MISIPIVFDYAVQKYIGNTVLIEEIDIDVNNYY